MSIAWPSDRMALIRIAFERRPPPTADEYQKEIPVIVILTEYEGSHYLYQMESELRLSTSTSTGLLANRNMYSSNQLNFTDVVARLISPYLRPDSNLGALSSAVFYHYYTEYLQRHNGITNKQIFDQEAFTITASVSRFRLYNLVLRIDRSRLFMQGLRSKLFGERLASAWRAKCSRIDPFRAVRFNRSVSLAQ